MRKRTVVMLILSVVVLGGLAGVAAGVDPLAQAPPAPGPPGPPGSPPPWTAPTSSPVAVPCVSVEQSLNFVNYWAGASFDGLGLTAAIRRCDKAQADDPGRANYVSYVYGDCDPAGEEGCAPPIEIQSWSPLEVTKQMFTYSTPASEPRSSTDTVVGGAPATTYDDGKQLVIFRADSTVMIFGEDPARVERFGNALAEGPDVLTGLARSGLAFDPNCVTNPNYCVARRTFTGDFDVTIDLTPPADIPPFINIGGARYPTGQYSGSGTGTATFVRPDGTLAVNSPMNFSVKGDYSTAPIESISLKGIFTGTQQVGGASFGGRASINIDDLSRQAGKANLWFEGQPSSILADYDVTRGCTPSDCGISSVHVRGTFLP
jgi:hypothetical protein